jgi:dTDP-4-amino-4,6-dideoxygalactose transaminase
MTTQSRSPVPLLDLQAQYQPLRAELQAAGLVVLPIEPAGYHHIYNQYVVRLPDRDRVRRELAGRSIGTEVHYPVPVHLQECFADLGYAKGAFPHAETAAASSLALPIYPELTEAQQGAVVEEIAGALGR